MLKILLLTPPFTQLNTPYPATAYLKGFLNTKGYPSRQADLGIEVILELFSEAGLRQMFARIDPEEMGLSENTERIFALRNDYLRTIGPVISFLQNKNPTLAHAICGRAYLPEAERFAQLDDLEWAFGKMGTHDQARHLATLYLEDLGDLLTECIDPHFGFSRYAERLGSTAVDFTPIHEALCAENTLVSETLLRLLAQKIKAWKPDVVCLSVPFPGNLFGALKCGQYLKAKHPEIHVVLGGGYANTELRRLADERVFDHLDYVCLDDGEGPLLHLLESLAGLRPKHERKRTFARQGGVVQYQNASPELDIPQREAGTPDYSDLLLGQYLSVIEIANPMHSLWSNGRWNKLTLAHGCYWGKCTFCDVTLDYIGRYEPLTASQLCDRIQQIIDQTGEHGFHFVDEAAPPKLLRDVALEIIRRGMTVVWWTNIRFEKNFTPDLCRLLKASGCIAISGGLEVASDRLLELIKKGVTVAQVARVAHAFTEAGIMVHAYLMYGFPTQTAQETIDSLEMVRQLFEAGVLQSGFWHRFAMTAHSPVGLAPAEFSVAETGPGFAGFADNDRWHDDPSGAHHDLFSEGLKKSIFNYMHGVCFDSPHSEWFGFEVPKTAIHPRYIEFCLENKEAKKTRPNTQIVWLGPLPEAALVESDEGPLAVLHFHFPQKEYVLETTPELGQWLVDTLPELAIGPRAPMRIEGLQKSFDAEGLGRFDDFLLSDVFLEMRGQGLLLL